ncbi:hypothetical protein C0992_006971, partial [Termitomyces sp. T32_za158]
NSVPDTALLDSDMVLPIDSVPAIASTQAITPITTVSSCGPPVAVLSPITPAAVASPTVPAAVTSPTVPAAVTSPTIPAAVTSPTIPAAVTSPTVPAAITSPTMAAAVASPTVPAAITSLTMAAAVAGPTVPAAVVSPSTLPAIFCSATPANLQPMSSAATPTTSLPPADTTAVPVFNNLVPVNPATPFNFSFNDRDDMESHYLDDFLASFDTKQAADNGPDNFNALLASDLPNDDVLRSRSGRQITASKRAEGMNKIGTSCKSLPTGKENIALGMAEVERPGWRIAAEAHLLLTDLGKDWKKLVEAWILVENTLVSNSRSGLAAKSRPEEWQKWISKSVHGSRAYTATPVISDPLDFGYAMMG